MRRARVKPVKTRTYVVQFVCLAVVVVLGLFMFIGKSGDASAQQGGGAGRGGGGRAAAAKPPPAPPADAGVAEDKGDKNDEKKGDKDKDKKEDDEDPNNPLNFAVVGDGGGVPTHPGYKFKSPFGNPKMTKPIRVKVGLVINSVDEYDIKSGTFEADFFLSLTADAPMPKLDLKSPNGKLEEPNVIADKPTFKLLRMTGKFKSPPNLRTYPFDSQVLQIELEDDTYGFDTVRLVPDPERTDANIGFEVLGWDVQYLEARILSHAYPDRFEGDDLYYGRYVFRVGVDRYGTSSIFKVYVPALVIVIIGLLGMWVPPDEMEVRSNAGAPMLAGAVLFHFALMQELPATSYLTRADKLMMGVYGSLLLNMISTWWMFLVKEDNQEVVFRIARIAVPTISVIIMALACTV